MTDFLDANVVLYTFGADVRKRDIAEGLLQEAANGQGTISFQVVQEVLNVLIRRGWAEGPERLTTLREVLMPLWSVMPSPELCERALGIQSRYRYTFYDSLIIAAALEAGCTRLYTEDLQGGQRIEGLTITNPFT